MDKSERAKADLWIEGMCVLLLIFYLVATLYVAYMIYLTAKLWAFHYLSSTPFSILKKVPGMLSLPQQNQQMREALNLPDIRRGERINILLLGEDKRPSEQGPARTDTIILISVEPNSKTVSMLSIPRDLWVPIPGYGEGRINTANFIGEKNGYPGGGSALAKKTVQYNFGVPVHYYVKINFEGFKRIIDLIGGIDIYVEKEINDPTYPAYDGYGYEPLHIPAGWQHMNGDLALKYARTRHGSSDFDRLRRQQQIIMAVRERVMSLDLIPKLLPKLPELAQSFSDSVQTDIPMDVILELAAIAREIEPQNIKRAVIDSSMCLNTVTPAGAEVLIPLRDKIRPLIEELFATPTPVVAQVPSREAIEKQRIALEGAKIVVQNGTGDEELTEKVVKFLLDKGFQVVAYGPADRTDYQHTVIVNYTYKNYTLEQLALIFNVRPEEIRHSPVNLDGIDIRVIVGKDFSFPSDR